MGLFREPFRQPQIRRKQFIISGAPAALSESLYPGKQSFVGPFKVGGAFYVAILGTVSNQVVVMKATADPTVDGNWSSQDGTVEIGATVESLWSVVDSTDIHVITQEADGRLQYHKFDTSTDTWTIKDEAVGNTTNTPDTPACSVAIRSDGDVIVLYAETDGSGNEGIHYARREATVWTADVQVDNGGTADWKSAVVIKGSSDRMHFFFKDNTLGSDDGYQRTLTSANVLETFQATFDSTTNDSNLIFGQGVSYDDGGTQRVRAPYVDDVGRISVAKLDSADAPGVTVDVDAGDNLGPGPGGAADVTTSLAVDVKNIHLLYVDASRDIFHDENDDDAGYGTDDEELDGVTANNLNSNVYDRSGLKLAYIYEDVSTVKYGERDIAVAVVSPGMYYQHYQRMVAA